ncbi:hypothetical protein RSAG8_05895, partial [Rhizoctonia solani AG-8 WAC10335]
MVILSGKQLPFGIPYGGATLYHRGNQVSERRPCLRNQGKPEETLLILTYSIRKRQPSKSI